MSHKNTLLGRVSGAVVAMCAALALAACSVGPLTLPDLPNPLAGTSVEKATEEAQRDPSVAPPTIASAGVLTVGITPTTAPYTYLDSDGEFAGLDIDFAAALADEMGLKVRFSQVTGSADAVAQGVDVFLSTTAAGAPEMAVVGTYEESASGLFRKGAAGVVAASDITGKSIGVQANSTSAAVLQKMVIDASAREYDSVNDAFAALDMGTVDYVLCDASMGAFVARTYDSINFCGSVGEAVPMGVAVSHANLELQEQVRAVVDRMEAGGRTALLRRRWLGELPTLSDDTRVMGVQVTSGSVPVTEVVDSELDLTTGSNAVEGEE